MTDEELDETLRQLRIHGAETLGVEAKRARPELPKRLWETLSAFSNSPGGGVLLLGAEERALRGQRGRRRGEAAGGPRLPLRGPARSAPAPADAALGAGGEDAPLGVTHSAVRYWLPRLRAAGVIRATEADPTAPRMRYVLEEVDEA